MLSQASDAKQQCFLVPVTLYISVHLVSCAVMFSGLVEVLHGSKVHHIQA